MRIDDSVTWTSQAGGYKKEKNGIIVEVVKPGDLPNRDIFWKLYKHSGVGMSRNHESYVVEVKKKHYWPRVKNLIELR